MSNKYINPLRVFISSAMKNPGDSSRDKITDLRSRLKKRLNHYHFIKAYTLEDGGPTVLTLNTEYITQLRDSNLAIILLDARYDIPVGVQNEISAAKQNKIPRIYFIIPDEADNGENLKDKIIAQGEARFVVPLELAGDYVSSVENLLFTQMVSVFKAYFDSQIDAESKPDESAGKTNNPLPTTSQFSKEFFDQVSISKQTVQELVFHDNFGPKVMEPGSLLDQGIFQLIGQIFFDKKLPADWDIYMLRAIDGLSGNMSSEYKKVLSTRLRAMSLFFSGDYQSASSLLKDLLQGMELSALPVWILQDTLIDLRNLLVIEDQENNRFRDNPYQKKLDNITEVFYYPGIDHSIQKVSSWVRNEKNKLFTSQSNEESAFGPGIGVYTDALVDATVYATCNGSIAQTRQLPRNLNLISEMLLQKYESPEYLRDVLRNMLLMGRSFKEIERWTRRYGYLLGQFSNEDSMIILQAVHSYPDGYEKLGIESNALRLVADYLGDDDFDAEWRLLSRHIEEWTGEQNLVVQPANDVFGLFRYCFRIPQNEIIAFVDKMIPRAKRYYDNLADIISGAIDHFGVSEEERKIIVHDVLSMLQAREAGSVSPKLELAIGTIITEWPTEAEKLAKFLRENMAAFYDKNIKPYLWINQSEQSSKEFVDSNLALMNAQNTAQKGGVIWGFDRDPVASIHSFLAKGFTVGETTVNQILEALVKILNNSDQTISEKQSAVCLVMELLSQSDDSQLLRNKLRGKINIDSLDAKSLSFFEIQAPTQQLEAIRAFLKISLIEQDNGNLLSTLTLNTSGRYLLFVSELLIDFIPVAMKSRTLRPALTQVVQFLITNNNRARENQLLINICNCFLRLLSFERYSTIASGQLQRLVSDTNDVVKRQMVVLINALPNKGKGVLDGIKSPSLQFKCNTLTTRPKRP
ncbi:MAG: hypothetical protein LKJ46_00895 [Lactobacillus sp.]|nr:hypothetical protein [Lactobacillus sp.]MCI1971156.1 hypothetical protein [Lactobacillus sp.]MCI2016390.1 hypothetical protein [Lactobacillus sp.]MCI2037683.1 hypothetical protein [Lactobacillus sp.]